MWKLGWLEWIAGRVDVGSLCRGLTCGIILHGLRTTLPALLEEIENGGGKEKSKINSEATVVIRVKRL